MLWETRVHNTVLLYIYTHTYCAHIRFSPSLCSDIFDFGAILVTYNSYFLLLAARHGVFVRFCLYIFICCAAMPIRSLNQKHDRNFFHILWFFFFSTSLIRHSMYFFLLFYIYAILITYFHQSYDLVRGVCKFGHIPNVKDT